MVYCEGADLQLRLIALIARLHAGIASREGGHVNARFTTASCVSRVKHALTHQARLLLLTVQGCLQVHQSGSANACSAYEPVLGPGEQSREALLLVESKITSA